MNYYPLLKIDLPFIQNAFFDRLFHSIPLNPLLLGRLIKIAIWSKKHFDQFERLKIAYQCTHSLLGVMNWCFH